MSYRAVGSRSRVRSRRYVQHFPTYYLYLYVVCMYHLFFSCYIFRCRYNYVLGVVPPCSSPWQVPPRSGRTGLACKSTSRRTTTTTTATKKTCGLLRNTNSSKRRWLFGAAETVRGETKNRTMKTAMKPAAKRKRIYPWCPNTTSLSLSISTLCVSL